MIRRMTGICTGTLLLCSILPVAARPFHKLHQNVLGCSDKRDTEDIALLKTQGRTDAIAAYGHGRCLQLAPRTVMVDRWEKGYACVHHSAQLCLWVPAESLSKTGLDDGVF